MNISFKVQTYVIQENKSKKTSITNFTQEKLHLPKCPAFFIHLNIFLDYISLCLEAYIHILGFSWEYT